MGNEIDAMNKPLPIIGGYLHGEYASFDGHIMVKATPNDELLLIGDEVRLRDKHNRACVVPVEEHAWISTRYTKQEVHINLGALTIGGWCWLHESLASNKAYSDPETQSKICRLMMSMLFAGCMK